MRQAYTNVCILCKRRGITIGQLERDVGLGERTLYNWNKHVPNVTVCKKVADYFGVTIDELISEGAV